MKKWSGDHQYQLPENMVEPYRLWFYALQLAHRVDGLKINKKFYKEWGDVENTDFSKWWSKHWRDLFAVNIGVRQIENEDDYKVSVDENSMIVRIPLNQHWSKTESELKTILKTIPVKDRELGKFHLTNSKRLDRNAIRLSLKVFEHKLDGYNLYETSEKITKWFDSWSDKKRKVTYPSSLYNVGKQLERGEKVDPTGGDYRSASRIRKRGERLVVNVANGEFPGKY